MNFETMLVFPLIVEIYIVGRPPPPTPTGDGKASNVQVLEVKTATKYQTVTEGTS